MRKFDKASEPARASPRQSRNASRGLNSLDTFYPKVMITRDRRLCGKAESSRIDRSLSEDGTKNASRDSEIELLEENAAGQERACPQMSGLTGGRETAQDTYASCRDCPECLALQRGVEKKEIRHRDCEESDLKKQEKPIFVDLTEEPKSWKQSLRKRQYPKKPSNDPPLIISMLADSSSRFHRTTNNSLATALRDRGPCFIPVQPNRSLPIRPAPPPPTRTSSISKLRDHSASLKLSKAMSLDVVEVEEAKSIALMADDEKNGETSDEPTDLTVHVSSKRKSDKEKETKDSRKRRKSHEADSSQEERIESILKEYSRNLSNTLIDKAAKVSQGMPELWDDKKCSSGTVVSTTEETLGKEKGNGNKVVPPLRLKKIVREGSTEEYCNLEMISEAEKESNYRIVNSNASRSDSISKQTTCAVPRSSIDDDLDMSETLMNRDSSICRAPVKSDNYKLKYRRNRLRQKLRELRSKALELAQQMANPQSSEESSPQHDTRLRQMMNCYEKQIENLSKLLNKLSSANSSSDDATDVDSNELQDHDGPINILEDESRNGESERSLSSSPEPPKLSPRSPMDPGGEKSLDDIRNSPPVLPRVCLAASDGQNPMVGEGSWAISGSSPSKSNEERNERVMVEYEERTQPLPGQLPDLQGSMINIEVEKSGCNLKDVLPPASKIAQTNESIMARGRNENREEEPVRMSKTLAEEVEGFSFKTPDSSSRIRVTAIEGVANSIPVKVPMSVRCSDPYGMIPSTSTRQTTPGTTMTNMLQMHSNYHLASAGRNNVYVASDEDRNAQKVTSSSNQTKALDSAFFQVNSTVSTANSRITDDVGQNDSVQRSDNSRIITEQFPTLGNWAAKMSKKQATKPKPKPQPGPSIPTPSTEDPMRSSEQEVLKMATSNVNNNIRNNVVNVAPQWNTERWQRQHQQHRQHQQLLQQVAAAAAAVPSQSLPPTAAPRPGICPPLSMTQFYPNNYTIDPYGAAGFGYHSAMCPYGSYSYHSRLHPPLSGYHIPIQDPLTSSLRPVQHVDKRLSSLQDPSRHFTSDIVKYSVPFSAGSFQHPSTFDFDRLRTSASSHNGGATGCLPPLLLPPPSLPSSVQQRTPLSGYSPNASQYGRNRMIPDVVAAAAAAAVVAAASIGRQGPLSTYSGQEEAASAGSIADADPSLNPSRPSGSGREHLSGQQQLLSTGEETRLNNGGYHQLQNLFDGLPFVKTDDNLLGQSSAFNTAQASTSTYKPSAAVSRGQMVKETANSNLRNCETPHLGKVNRSPDTINNIECSNCGLAGSMFKCLGCEAAFYCNERCQARHWSIHVEKCPKKMPKLKKVV